MVSNMSRALASSERASFLRSASLYVLVDSVDYLEERSASKLCKLIENLISAGVHLIQFRDKRLNDRQLVEVGKRIALTARGTKTKFIMNDRVDLALAIGADGVHLGQEDVALEDARKICGPEKIIGVSTHTLLQASQATEQGADYIGIGPLFPSATKSFDQFIELELLARIAREIKIPAFAIGGIDQFNIDRVIESGIRRVAVGTSITKAADPRSVATELLKKLRSGESASQ